MTGLIAVYLHGSQARGHARPDSDVDVAILAPHGWDAARLEEVAYQLARAIGRQFGKGPESVDVQDLARAPAEFRTRAMTTGRLLFVGDPTALARFQREIIQQHLDDFGAFASCVMAYVDR